MNESAGRTRCISGRLYWTQTSPGQRALVLLSSASVPTARGLRTPGPDESISPLHGGMRAPLPVLYTSRIRPLSEPLGLAETVPRLSLDSLGSQETVRGRERGSQEN